MNILNQDLLLGLASVIYAATGVHFWRSRWTPQAPAAGKPLSGAERALMTLGLGLHGLGLYGATFPPGGMQFSFSLALSLMLLLAVFVYWLESFTSRVEGLQTLVMPPAAACALLPVLFSRTHPLEHAASLGFRLHFLSAMLAYSLFTLAVLHALLMGFAEQKLHRRSLSRGLIALPPLLSMESLLFRLVWVAFALLTIAVGSGVFFSETIYGQPLRLDHKTIFAIVSWVSVAALLAGRHYLGWRGKTAQRWVIAGFITLLLAYVGSRFVAEVILGR